MLILELVWALSSPSYGVSAIPDGDNLEIIYSCVTI